MAQGTDDKHCAAPPKLSGGEAVTCSSLQCLLEQAKEHGHLQLWEGKWKSAKHFPDLESAYDIIVSFCLSACPEDFQSAQSSSSPGDSMNSGYNFERLEQLMNFHLYLDTERLQKLI